MPYELWTSKKPSIKHLSHERKLDSRTISCYFVGYVEHSRGYKFYYPTSRSFSEIENARILEEVDPCASYCSSNNSMSLRISIKEKRHAILNDYIVFLQEHENDIGLIQDDPINFYQAMQCSNSQK
ncbi:hypothetical protein CR513_24910, partial [Mucuna pruriens]